MRTSPLSVGGDHHLLREGLRPPRARSSVTSRSSSCAASCNASPGPRRRPVAATTCWTRRCGRTRTDGNGEADGSGAARDPAQSFDFLFNLWLTDDDFRAAAFNPTTARWATHSCSARRACACWRTTPSTSLPARTNCAGTRTIPTGRWPSPTPSPPGSPWTTPRQHNGAMLMACGSQHLGERLPVVFGTGTPYLRESRPATVAEVGDPEQLGLAVEVVELGRRRGVDALGPHVARLGSEPVRAAAGGRS